MKHFLFLFLFFWCNAVAAQDLIPVKLLSNTKSGPERYAGADAFGWQYTIHDNELRKWKDERVLKYRALSLGDIYRTDLQNPLQIVLFYKKFNTAVLLDNQLNETARINFSDIPEPVIADAVSLASQNRLWVYEPVRQQLGLYDPARQKFITITPPFTQPLKGYHSDYNYFYWTDALNNFYASNLFGKVSALGTIPAYELMQVISEKQVLLKTEGGLFLYLPQAERLLKIDIVEKSFHSFYYKDQILSIFTGSEIIQYKITLQE